MQILVTVVLFVVLSQAVDCQDAALYRPRRRSSQNCKYEMCKKIPNFPIENCTYLDFYMYDPCSYSCYCYGNNFWYYGSYQEKRLSSCGNDKVCWDGYCEDIEQNANCTCKYGKDYIAIADSYEPCTYKCVQKNGCNTYQENKDYGTCCYNRNCLRTGKCDMGTCYVEGGRGCSQRYYPYYDTIAGKGAQNANDASVGSSGSGSGNDNPSNGKSLGQMTEEIYKKGKAENNEDAAVAACDAISKSYSSETNYADTYQYAKKSMAKGKSMAETAKMCHKNAKKYKA